jgi:putative MATE family efflux protein
LELPREQAYKNFLSTAWPVVVESVLVSLISSVDTMMVGKLGRVAIAAVGLTQQPRLLMLMLIMSLNVGVMTVVGKFKGAGNQEEANRCLKSAIVISLALSLVMVVPSFLFAEQVIRFSGGNTETLEWGILYFRYIIIGNVFQSVSLTITAAQRGIGNTKISLRTNLLANIVNICLNYCLIGGHLGFPALGVEGAAIATMSSNIAALAVAVFSACRTDGYLNISANTGFAPRSVLLSVYQLSKGVLFERIGFRAGIWLFYKIVASLGTLEFAAYNICQRFTNLSYSLGDGLSIAAVSLVAQSLGAQRNDDAKVYGQVGLKIASGAAALYMVIVLLGRGFWISLFTDDMDVASLCMIGITSVSLIGLVHVPQTLLMGTLRGAGDSNYLARVVLISTMIFRPAFGWLLCIYWDMGMYGVYISFGCETALRFLLTARRFKHAKWFQRAI